MILSLVYDNFIEIFLIITPVLLSGITFIFFIAKYPTFLNTPVDMKQEINGKRIFGKNKTFRGFFYMPIFTTIYGFILSKFFNLSFNNFQIITNYYFVGLMYPLGELPNSFIKRRINIEPGKKSDNIYLRFLFNFFDTYDSLVFCALGYFILFSFSLKNIIFATMLGGLIHLATNKIKEKFI